MIFILNRKLNVLTNEGNFIEMKPKGKTTFHITFQSNEFLSKFSSTNGKVLFF